MRNLLIAAALGIGLLSAGAAIPQASAAPFNPGRIEAVGVTPVQYYGGHYRRPYYGPRHYAPRYYAPRPRYYGYAPPPPRPRYYAPRPYYRRW